MIIASSRCDNYANLRENVLLWRKGKTRSKRSEVYALYDACATV